MDGLENLIGQLADMGQLPRAQFISEATPLVQQFVWDYANEQVTYELRDRD